MPKEMDRCEQLASPDVPNFIVSCIIVVGLVLSYLPQHYRIIARRSSDGLSPYFVLLGTTSGTCAIANILTLPQSRTDITCCKVNSGFSCFAGLLGIVQIGLQWSCFFLIMFLFLIFIPRPQHDRQGVLVSSQKSHTTPMQAVAIVVVSIIHFIATLLISVLVLAIHPDQLQTWANILGLLAALLGSIQYIPQIYTTWTLKHVGSLSIPMMCIQTPGGFIFAASLAARLGVAGWSAWSVYIVLGTLQGVLLVMAICFEVRDRRKAKRPKYSKRRSVTGSLVGHPTPDDVDDFDTEDEGARNVEGDGEDEDAPLLREPPRWRLNTDKPGVLDPDRLAGDSSDDASPPNARTTTTNKSGTIISRPQQSRNGGQSSSTYGTARTSRQSSGKRS
ncbi:MAG: hypothetical protein M1828_004623 [Chrysothrix sp. TS-e1954]|nr:MAG: hypothetical protein M1828_004623 [Chrysothrix sp. TS-e1954]